MAIIANAKLDAYRRAATSELSSPIDYTKPEINTMLQAMVDEIIDGATNSNVKMKSCDACEYNPRTDTNELLYVFALREAADQLEAAIKAGGA